MSWNGPGYIAKVDVIMDSALYIQILQEDLQMSVKGWLAKDEFVFHTTMILSIRPRSQSSIWSQSI
jgi:hypothetical protein